MRLHKYKKTIRHCYCVCALAAWLILGACSHTPRSQAQDTQHTALWLANQYIAQADYLGAMRLLDSVAPQYRTSIWHGSYALLYAQQGYLEQAEKQYQFALEHTTLQQDAFRQADAQSSELGHVDAIRLNYASLLIKQKRYTLAQAQLQPIALANRGHVSALAYFNLGLSRYRNAVPASRAADDFWHAVVACASCSPQQQRAFIDYYLTFAQSHMIPFAPDAQTYAIAAACQISQFAWLLQYNWSDEVDRKLDAAAWRKRCGHSQHAYSAYI